MLAGRSGSELYAAEVASALLARGHSPVLYTPAPGPLARDLQARSIPVVSDLRKVTEPPDIIHGQHTHETLCALLAFPGVPAVRVHHGWNDTPPHPFPRIRRHVVVDETVRDRLVSEWGVPRDWIDVLYNFVDPSVLPPRGPLPRQPVRALVFSNNASHHLAAVRAACAARSIEVDAVGADVDRVTDRPGELLGKYDVVFAKARCAMEALAVGAAVVLCDRAGVGPMVLPDNFDELRRFNFGLRTLRAPVTAEEITRPLSHYDPTAAGVVSARIRSEATIDDAVRRLLDTYMRVIEEWEDSASVAVDEELRCAADYLQRIRATPAPRDAAGALLKAAFFRLRQMPLARHVVPSSDTALRIYRSIKGS